MMESSGYKVIAAVTSELISSTTAKLHSKIDTSADDALVAAWIIAAREMAQHYTGRGIGEQTIELALDEFPDDEDDWITLPLGPVASITSIKYTDLNGTEQTISSANYALSLYGESNKVAPTYGNNWPSARDIPDAVRIRYVTGYTSATLPAAVQSAMLLMIAWMNEHRGSEMDADDIQPPAAKALLGTVRLWGRA